MGGAIAVLADLLSRLVCADDPRDIAVAQDVPVLAILADPLCGDGDEKHVVARAPFLKTRMQAGIPVLYPHRSSSTLDEAIAKPSANTGPFEEEGIIASVAPGARSKSPTFCHVPMA